MLKRKFIKKMVILGMCSISILLSVGCSGKKANVHIGEYVEFGEYEQDNNEISGQEPILWQVIDVKDDKALLSSCYVLDNIQYCDYGDDDTTSAPWARSYIYSWLNEDFYNSAFSESEAKAIIDSTDYSAENVEEIGKVFLFSYQEILKYYDTDSVVNKSKEYECVYTWDLLAKPTEYAKEKDVECRELTQERIDFLIGDGLNCENYVAGDEYAKYWLRSSLKWDSWFTAEGHALYVDSDGKIQPDVVSLANMKTKRQGVKPCVWVDLKIVGDDLVTVKQ